MTRRPLLVAAALALLVLFSSCRSQDNTLPPVEEQDRIIATASLTDDPSMLRLTWFPVDCETFTGVEVELDDDFANLRIRTTVDIVNCPPGGFSETTVDLGQPLGDRQIWDRAFGDTVAITE